MQIKKYREMNTSTCKMILKFCSTSAYGVWVILSKVWFCNKWSQKNMALYWFCLFLGVSSLTKQKKVLTSLEKGASFFHKCGRNSWSFVFMMKRSQSHWFWNYMTLPLRNHTELRNQNLLCIFNTFIVNSDTCWVFLPFR